MTDHKKFSGKTRKPAGRGWRASLLLALLLAALMLAGCRGKDKSHEIPVPTATQAPTDTPLPTATPEPTATPTPLPTDTPTPEPTATPTATDTPAPTDTPTPEPAEAGRPLPSTELVYLGNPTAPDGRPQVNISFDVEGDPNLLYQILDILDEHKVRTTFFLQGEWVSWYPEAVQKIAERGHELGNHSWTHQNFSQLPAEEVTTELMDTENLIVKLTGQSTRPFFRPPYGSRSDVSIQTAYELGWTNIIWTYGAEDWVEGATAETVHDNVFGNAAPGALYYMHTSRRIDVDALGPILQSFQDEGYALVTVGEILGGGQ